MADRTGLGACDALAEAARGGGLRGCLDGDPSELDQPRGICRLRSVVGLYGITSRKSIDGWPGALARAGRHSRTGM